MIHFNSDAPYEVLKNYLPNEINQKEGGSLLALGIIKVMSFDEEDNEFLMFFLDSKDSLTDEIAFGACTAIGLINLGSNNELILDKLLKISKLDQTLLVESSVYGLGLVALKTCNLKLLDDLKVLQNETEFERVKRVVSISYSLIIAMSRNKFYSESETKFINELLESKDGTTRFGGVLSLGTAYVGTGNISIISKLLRFINDGDDDVKRAAVIAIAFVCCNDDRLLIGTLEPLSENHNFYVRSAVALCLGFFLAGTGNETCCDITEALMYDSNNLVRQAACIGSGFLIMQCNPSQTKNYRRIVNQLNKILVDRQEEKSVKYGAGFGRGISEAGGRNIIFSIKNLSGKITPDRLAGAILFLNHWYWYPLSVMLTLNHLPTAFFAFDENLNELDVSIDYKGNYNNHLIRLPDIRKSRRFKQKIQEEKETITNASETIKSSERCTLLQMREADIKLPGIIFKPSYKK